MLRYALLAWLTLGLAGCGKGPAEPTAITLATTTSTRDSGLLDVLLPMFEKEQQIQVKVIAVGSGQALELGRRGDADVLLTHAPQLETRFVEEGYGLKRHELMRNDFVVVGPADDPAGIKHQNDGAGAMKTIADRQSRFISRGDQSGTHLMEQALWERSGMKPSGQWHVEAGAGMAATLRMAHEKQAYTLTDRATYLSLRNELDLQIVLENDPALDNIYSVIVINPSKHPQVNAVAAQALADFLLSPKCQDAIGKFGVEQFGEPVFFPVQTK